MLKRLFPNELEIYKYRNCKTEECLYIWIINHTLQGLGMSEAPCITTNMMNERKPGSCGILPSNTAAKIIDSDSGKTLGTGQVGELCVKGPQVP